MRGFIVDSFCTNDKYPKSNIIPEIKENSSGPVEVFQNGVGRERWQVGGEVGLVVLDAAQVQSTDNLTIGVVVVSDAGIEVQRHVHPGPVHVGQQTAVGRTGCGKGYCCNKRRTHQPVRDDGVRRRSEIYVSFFP